MSEYTYTVHVKVENGRVMDVWAEDSNGNNLWLEGLAVFAEQAAKEEAAHRQDMIDAKADAKLSDWQERKHDERS